MDNCVIHHVREVVTSIPIRYVEALGSLSPRLAELFAKVMVELRVTDAAHHDQ